MLVSKEEIQEIENLSLEEVTTRLVRLYHERKDIKIAKKNDDDLKELKKEQKQINDEYKAQEKDVNDRIDLLFKRMSELKNNPINTLAKDKNLEVKLNG